MADLLIGDVYFNIGVEMAEVKQALEALNRIIDGWPHSADHLIAWEPEFTAIRKSLTEADELRKEIGRLKEQLNRGWNELFDMNKGLDDENARLKAELAALKQQHKCTSRCQISGCADADKYMGDSVPRAGGAINYSEGVIKIPAKIDDVELDMGIGALRWTLNRLREKPRTTLDSALNKTVTSDGITNGQRLEKLWSKLYYTQRNQ